MEAVLIAVRRELDKAERAVSLERFGDYARAQSRSGRRDRARPRRASERARARRLPRAARALAAELRSGLRPALEAELLRPAATRPGRARR